MERTLSTDLPKYFDETVRIRGWLHAIRPLGKVNFVIVRDAGGLIQIVVEKEELKKLHGLQIGTVLTATGKAVKSAQAELGVEITESELTVEEGVTDVPPIEYNKPDIPSDLDFILDHRTLSLRNRKIAAVFKIQAEIAHAYRLFMHDWERGVEYFPPNIIGASSEGGAEFFSVDYFGNEATLAQSSQLYKQILVGVHEKVYAIVPFFRAEPSHTTRHLTEGKQLEFEMGFFESWHDIMDVEERCMKFILNHLQDTSSGELALLGAALPAFEEEAPFPRIPFAEAQEIYFQRTGVDERQESDLSPAAERELCKHAHEYFKTDFVFITDWLWEKRPFYSFKNPEHPHLTHTFDLLCAGTEITSGGQRRNTYASMVEGILEKGMDPAQFTDYLDIFKYGMPRHGGFGVGLERLTMTFLGLKNIREASLFPSDPKRIASNRIKAKLFFGGENIRGEIIRCLKERGVAFEHLVHEETPTSEDSARVRKVPMEEGIKAIILLCKKSKKNVMVCLRADKKIDIKKVQALIGEKVEFERPEVILERFGLKIGGIPPVGRLLNLETIYDVGVQQISRADFNCGLTTESILMQTDDLLALAEPSVASIAV